MGILSNWPRVSHGWSVTGQWHLRNPSNKHKYTDIVLDKDIRIVLGVLATGNEGFIRSYIEKTPEYKSLLAAEEAWVVHFTCQDDFRPIWQSDTDSELGWFAVGGVSTMREPLLTRRYTILWFVGDVGPSCVGQVDPSCMEQVVQTWKHFDSSVNFSKLCRSLRVLEGVLLLDCVLITSDFSTLTEV